MIIDLCKALKLPTVAREAERLANEAGRQEVTHLAYLEQLLELEMADRAERRAYRRMREAGFPLVKTMEGFDFTRNSNLSQAKLRTLATGDWIDAAESVILMGEPGTSGQRPGRSEVPAPFIAYHRALCAHRPAHRR